MHSEFDERRNVMNFCRFCGTPQTSPVSTCPACNKPLQALDEESPAHVAVLTHWPVPENLTSVTTFPQQIPTHNREHLAEQQAAQAQLHQQLQEQLAQHRLSLVKQLEAYKQEIAGELAKKQDKPETGDEQSLMPWQRRAVGFFLVVASLAFLVSLLLIILYSKSNHRNDALILVSTAMVVFGGFYLAYDLLDRQNGPLLWLTTYVTYALIGILGASLASAVLIFQDMNIIPLNTTLQHISSDPTTGLNQTDVQILTLLTRSALLCLLWGAIIGLCGNLLTRTYKRVRFSWRRIFCELLLCIGFWQAFFSIFIPLLALIVPDTTPYGPFITFLTEFIFASGAGILSWPFVRLYRFFVIHKLSAMRTSRPRLYWAIFIFTTLLILSIAASPMFLVVVIAWSTKNPNLALTWPIVIAFGFALSGTLTTIIAPITVRWFNSLREKQLGGFGLVLVSLGTILNIIPFLFDLVAR